MKNEGLQEKGRAGLLMKAVRKPLFLFVFTRGPRSCGGPGVDEEGSGGDTRLSYHNNSMVEGVWFVGVAYNLFM